MLKSYTIKPIYQSFKIKKFEKLKLDISEIVKSLFINQNRIDEIVEELYDCGRNIRILED